MLLSLRISNIALIDNIEMQFKNGFHVLTGETGAGKSIIIDAFNLLVGNRADKSLIRLGSEKASVEAFFDISNNSDIKEVLHNELIDFDNDIISIMREISIKGKNICRVCGVIVTLQVIKKIMVNLVDIHGQHDHQFLLNEKMHCIFLDDLGDNNHKDIIKDVEEKYNEWHRCGIALKKLKIKKEEAEFKNDILENQLKEISDVNLKIGEKEKLQEKQIELESYEKISTSFKDAYNYIDSNSDSDQTALQLIKASQYSIEKISNINENYKDMYKRISEVYYELEDICLELKNIEEAMSFDIKEYNAISSRLGLIKRLVKKYNMPVEELIQKEEQLRSIVNEYNNIDSNIDDYKIKYKKSLNQYREIANELTKSRKNIAITLESQMEKNLEDLGMSGTVFKVVFSDNENIIPGKMGSDHIAFYIAPNKGEKLSPLSQIASGGELSRIMLSLKTISADKDNVDCLIFDEIDTGISGYTANEVAKKISKISKYHQVLCVTHLAQIASMGDYQFFVEKHVKNERTLTSAVLLDDKGRIKEIARLLGTTEDNMETGLNHAQKMIEYSNQIKNK